MKFKKIVHLFLLLLPFGAVAQGIKFEQELSWAEVKAKAKAENKYIFVDCFTTWCAPCKRMAENVFPQKQAGDFMNDKFVSVQIQMDKTGKDNELVKKWYDVAAAMQKDYEIAAFPTLLFFTPDGNVVHRASSALGTEGFISLAADAMNPAKQYYTIQNKQKKAGDPDNLRKMALEARKIYDTHAANRYAEEYLATQTNLLTKENLEFVSYFTSKSTDKAFPLFITHEKEIDKLVGPGTAASKVRNIIRGELVSKEFSIANRNTPPDWDKLKAAVAEKFPDRADEVTSRYKVMFYQAYMMWDKFETEVTYYLKNYAHHTSASELNNLAMGIYSNCDDKSCLDEIVKALKITVDGGFDPAPQMHMYANLLYKSGNTTEAIAWEEKALAKAVDKKPYQDSLDKMKRGEKPWLKTKSSNPF